VAKPDQAHSIWTWYGEWNCK